LYVKIIMVIALENLLNDTIFTNIPQEYLTFIVIDLN
jgi:hypothetical protein